MSEVPVTPTQSTPVAGGNDGVGADVFESAAGVAAGGARLARGFLDASADLMESNAAPLLLLFGGGVALALALTRGRRR